MQYKLTIPGRLPGLNELIEAERANRYKGAQLKKDAERRICAEIRRQLHGVHIRRPVMMRYLWVEPDRRRDRDNITAGRKFVQDALVRCKVLQNDGWKEIAGFADDWAVDKARPRVEIEIIEEERGLTMGKKCLDCAKRQQINGWRVAREAYSLLWPILINNKAATLELSENQIQGLLDVTEEMTSIICGAEQSGMNVAEYAEYISSKADECRARLEAKS